MKVRFWRRQRVHRVGLGDLVALRGERWAGGVGRVRISSIGASWNTYEENRITITCSPEHRYLVSPERPARRFWWPSRKPAQQGADHAQ